MMVAGAVCGLCLAWSYHLVFEPIYTIPGLAAGVESPDAPLGQAILRRIGYLD